MKRLNIFDTNFVDNTTPYQFAQHHYIDNKFDLHSAGGANTFGYSHPYLINVIKENLDTATNSFWKLKHPVWDELSARIDLITSKQFESYLPALTGSDAVDNAIKLMWLYWNDTERNIILVRKNSYHSGSISGWQMVYGQNHTAQWPKYQFVEFFDDLEQTINLIGSKKIAGVIIDTVPWCAGITTNDHNWWIKFQEIITKNNLLLCVDEILTGMGRIGTWLHSESLSLKPNIVILGKALTAGHENFSLTILDKKITDNISDKWLAVGNTRSTNVMGAIVTCAVIDLMIKEGSLDYINNIVCPYTEEIMSLLLENGIDASATGTIVQGLTDKIQNIQTQLNNYDLYHNWSCFWHLPFYNISKEEMTKIKNALHNVLK